ncbi:MAG TPA: phage tail sheath C-terminal domain-containing protein [Thermoanaerobaculia bacterium]|nr:phage tail sheath C-terminal domain-containing protein [Thermoanaerobaculia bacterium]
MSDLLPMPAIAGVPTSIPIFIGVTAISGDSVLLTPVRIDSVAAFETTFGAAAQGNLPGSVKLFFANGGESCVVISAGPDAKGVTREALLAGLEAAGKEVGPSMTVVPDAVLLPTIEDFSAVARAMMVQAGTLQDRIAILDVYGAQSVTKETLGAVIESFRAATANDFLSWAAAYFPDVEAEEGQTKLPPSGAMAGIFAASDGANGVWNAPTNIAMRGIAGLTYALTDDDQALLTPASGGQAVNALRSFPPRGAVVWGARTLQWNDSDYRYVQIRRTLIYIEQSIKNMLRQFVFAPNDGNTWAIVVSMVSSFLQGVWSQGGLMGATASEAFTVQCGVGSTMTPQDILEGFMIVQVTLQMIRPAEFIALTFKQKMEGVG